MLLPFTDHISKGLLPNIRLDLPSSEDVALVEYFFDFFQCTLFSLWEHEEDAIVPNRLRIKYINEENERTGYMPRN